MNPPIFVSATTGDLGSSRDLVVSVLSGMGHQTRVQPTFPFVGGDLRAELRRLIDECAMVIQLVGFRCGRISEIPDPEFGIVSHTQYEARYAEKQGKRVLYITLPETYRFDECPEEPGDLASRQRAYREEIRARGDQRGTPNNPDALKALILQSHDHLAKALELAAKRHAELLDRMGDLPSLVAGELRRRDEQEKVQAAASLLETILDREFPPPPAYNSTDGNSPDYYVHREIEQDFRSFLQAPHSAMVIVGQSGVGKTTLTQHLLKECRNRRHPAALVSCSELFQSNLHSFQETLLSRIDFSGLASKVTWKHINQACIERDVCLVLFLDAVNEFNDGNGTLAFLKEIDEFLWGRFEESPTFVKLVITSRPETWTKGTEHLSSFASHAAAYFPDAERRPLHHLPGFTVSESQLAFENYRKLRGIQTLYRDLSELGRYLLRDPLLLDLATRAYANTGHIPRDLDAAKVFEDYHGRLSEPEQDVVRQIVKQFFGGRNGDSILRDEIDRSSDLMDQSPELYRSLSMETDGLGLRLKERNIIRVTAAPNKSRHLSKPVLRIRFNYDRFAEHLLACELDDHIRKDTKGTAAVSGKLALQGDPEIDPESLRRATVKVISANLESAQNMVTALGALRLTLLGLVDEENFPVILGHVAAIDARGLSLVISVLARVARARGGNGGHEIVKLVLKEAERAVIEGNTRSFPIIETVYRLLCDEEYRSWIDDQQPELKALHLDLLYGYFTWGFKHREKTVSGASIQHLFFLWQRGEQPDDSHSDRLFKDAVEITELIFSEIHPLSIRFVLSGTQRRLLPNAAGLMMLILAELREEKPATAALASGRNLIIRLRLRKSKLFLVLQIANQLLVKYLADMLRRVPNPVGFSSLRNYYKDRVQNCTLFGQVMSFIINPATTSDDIEPHLRVLVASDNSWILQMLTFALSTCHERAPDESARSRSLEMIRRLFFGEPPNERAEYCASLAMYHINYFGGKATGDSMRLMGLMAEHILRVRKGILTIAGKSENFNIVGTYGRALRRNGHLVDSQDDGKTESHALDYAFTAIEDAKRLEDPDFYRYVCQNIGLLGVLIEPSQVFDVIGRILEDTGGTGSTRGADSQTLPFERKDIEGFRRTILQSLANIRVLYRPQVDRYILEKLQAPPLYGRVVGLTSEFDLATFYSWTFEQLMFRLFNEHYQGVGSEVATVFLKCGECRSEGACLRYLLTWVMHRASQVS